MVAGRDDCTDTNIDTVGLHWWLASIRDAQAQLFTGHQDIRTDFSNTTAAEPITTLTATTTAPTTPTALFHLLAIRQRLQHHASR
jgi:hypothetical protein